MLPYYIEKSAVTPDEAIKAASVADGAIVFEVVPSLCRTIDRLVDERYGATRENWCLVLAALWMAGRIQGIREERQRRRSSHRATRQITND